MRLESIIFFISHPFISFEVWKILLHAQLNLGEQPLSGYEVDPETVIGKPLAQAAAMLGLLPSSSPSIDWGGRDPKLGNVPRHNDL